MAQQLHHPASETYFLVILFLLAYVMSSAPRFVREWKKADEKSLFQPPSPAISWKKALHAYTIQPYKNAWKQMSPKMELAELLP
jgi:hypothetical protein